MTEEDFQKIENVYRIRISKTNIKFVRYLYNKINWNTRLIGIKGARGAGKTTLLLQRIKIAHEKTDSVFYASLDNMWFQSHTLLELSEWIYQRGVRYLFLDEVHKYPNWAQTIKNLYDTYDDLNIVYTGSSMLEIDYSRVDLSRRQTLYTLHGMSFREYLELNRIAIFEPFNLDQLLHNHLDIAMTVCNEISVLKHYSNYLKYGYYPFQIEAGTDYLPRLAEIVNLVIDVDMPAVEPLSYASLQKAKQLLMVTVQNVPLVPNMSKLASQLETTRNICLKLLYTLDKAELLMLLTREAKSYKHLLGPEKIYLGNTNLMYALGARPNEGTLRETFFLNQLSAITSLTTSANGDFLTSDGLLFEVGGRGKDFTQIADIPESYLAVDNIEYGSRNRIPLWMFGLLY